MPRTQNTRKREMFTLRLDRDLKRKLSRLAKKDNTSLAGFIRQLARRHIEDVEQREFEAEARRQSLEAAREARDPNSEETAVMRWIEGVADTEGWT